MSLFGQADLQYLWQSHHSTAATTIWWWTSRRCLAQHDPAGDHIHLRAAQHVPVPPPTPTARLNLRLRSGVASGSVGNSSSSGLNSLTTPCRRSRRAPCARREPRSRGQGQGQQGGQAADAQTQFTRLTARIEGIAAAWNWAGPGCQFQHINLYSAAASTPAQVGLYGRPPNATDDALWARAIRENPDPGW
ncbi:hypothetical protein B0H14DRAFT_2380282 [Mycena olivaceomarginata]|nr:hypothetical protein B0H14DRAFT_2380282 [Mycena olivaceomarginata]